MYFSIAALSRLGAALLAIPLLLSQTALLTAQEAREYRVLATKKTSTLEKEMNEAAQAGYVFDSMMGGETALGGAEVVVVMGKPSGGGVEEHRAYRLLATQRTSTMQKELQQWGDEGFAYRGQSVSNTSFGGREVLVVLEKVRDAGALEYTVLATSKTSTMEKELRGAGEAGFRLQGLTVGKTAFGGYELVCILSKPAK